MADERDAVRSTSRQTASRPQEGHAELVLKGVGDVPAHVMLAVADEVRKAVARLNVADVRIRVSTRDDKEPALLSSA